MIKIDYEWRGRVIAPSAPNPNPNVRVFLGLLLYKGRMLLGPKCILSF